MAPQLVPGPLKRALDLLEADPGRGWTVDEVASACGVGRRTLQRHFRRFIGRMPMEFLRDLRLHRARQELLTAPGRANVTDIAARSGFHHTGRFATQYRARYGESPSATLSRNQRIAVGRPQRLTVLAAIERPAVAVLPFDLIGRDACRAAGITGEIAGALMRVRWIAIVVPARARYHLKGSVRDDGTGRLRVLIRLLDAATGRYLWADRWDSACSDLFEFEERVAERIAAAIQQPMREAEIDRAWRQDAAQLNAWELTMRALPRVLSVEAAAEEMALELLERAMERAPSDALPMALAAWCHGLRGCHNFCQRPDQEKAAARELARRAAQLNSGDPLTETMLSAGYCLAHDLATAAIHADRALVLDGSSAWAWGRSGWIKAYAGEAAEAIERFQIARARSRGPLELSLLGRHCGGTFLGGPLRRIGALVRARAGGESGRGLDQSRLDARLCSWRSQGARTAKPHRAHPCFSRFDDCTGQVRPSVSLRISRPHRGRARKRGHAPLLKEMAQLSRRGRARESPSGSRLPIGPHRK